MNQRKPNGPRVQQRPQQGPQSKKAQYWWYHHRHYHPYHDWYDYDWYDYDWYDYDWYDYSHTYDSPPNKPRRPQPPRGPIRTAEYSEDTTAYQQGFKDGWCAAMDYMMYGMEPIEPIPVPHPMPPSPTPTASSEGAPE